MLDNYCFFVIITSLKLIKTEERKNTKIILKQCLVKRQNMNIYNLKYFIALANDLSFTKAAEKLYISQQALSKYISSLENEYGTQLFIRKPKVALTKSGQIMLETAISILELELQLRRKLENENKANSKTLTIGMGPARSRFLLPEIFLYYRKHYEDINLRVMIDSAKILEQMLDSDEIDVWIGYFQEHTEKYHNTLLFEDKACIIISKKIMTELFREKEKEMVEKLSRKFEISYFAECSFMMLPEGHHFRQIVDTYFKVNQITPKYVLETNDLDTLIMLAMEGSAITFASSAYVMKYINSYFFKENAYLFYLDGNKTTQNITIYYKKDKSMSSEIKHFIELCMQLYNR